MKWFKFKDRFLLSDQPLCHYHFKSLETGISMPLSGYPAQHLLDMDMKYPWNGIFTYQGCMPSIEPVKGEKKLFCSTCKKLANQYLDSLDKM